MVGIVEQFAVSHPDAVVRRGGETYVAYESAEAVIDEAGRRGIRVLGLEGFLIADDATYPAFSRITDFSAITDQHSGAAAARNVLRVRGGCPQIATARSTREQRGGT